MRIGLAIALALFLDSPYCRGRKLFALVYFLPFAVPGVIAAIMWGFLLEPDLDSALKVPHQLGLTAGAVTPLDYRLSLYAIMLIVTWEFTGYNMTILLTSLTNVPHQVAPRFFVPVQLAHLVHKDHETVVGAFCHRQDSRQPSAWRPSVSWQPFWRVGRGQFAG